MQEVEEDMREYCMLCRVGACKGILSLGDPGSFLSKFWGNEYIYISFTVKT